MNVARPIVATSPNQVVRGIRTPALVKGFATLASAIGGIDVNTKQVGIAQVRRCGDGLHSRDHGALIKTANPTHIQKIPPGSKSDP
jgi:hypothetical protein